MARTENVALRNYRHARRKVNERLLKAEKEGRLDQELRRIEREAKAWWAKEEGARSRRRAK
ncbi:MAG TPA: hypothetical protein VMU54_12015 [Planctomycetota bacterium]|nr:hypothetical protein [Planctomycetota bacterium]